MQAPAAVAVCGSPRHKANSTLLAEAALAELAARGYATQALRLGELSVLPCLAHDGCKQFVRCPQKDDGVVVLDAVYAADVLVVASPVYYEDVSAQFKAFMDRNVFRYRRGSWLPARAVGLIAVTAETGLEETLATLRRYVAQCTVEAPPVRTLAVYARERGAVAEDPAAMAAARALGAELAGLALAGAAAPARRRHQHRPLP
jgi:multimeric flavodoxin WrbA